MSQAQSASATTGLRAVRWPVADERREVIGRGAQPERVDGHTTSPGVAWRRVWHPHSRAVAGHAVTPHWRNLDDAILAAIGQKGGVIGVTFCPFFLGGPLASIDRLCDHIEHVAKVAGPQAVALGSDFDGMIPLVRGMRDVRDLPRITEALHRRGWREPELRGVLGENFRRYFERVCGI